MIKFIYFVFWVFFLSFFSLHAIGSALQSADYCTDSETLINL